MRLFNPNVFNSLVFNTLESAANALGGGGGGHIRDYKKYRAHLESLAKISDERFAKKIEKIEKLEKSAPKEVRIALEAVTKDTYENSAFIKQQLEININQAIAKIDILIQKAVAEEMRREQEDEYLILLAITS